MHGNTDNFCIYIYKSNKYIYCTDFVTKVGIHLTNVPKNDSIIFILKVSNICIQMSVAVALLINK